MSVATSEASSSGATSVPAEERCASDSSAVTAATAGTCTLPLDVCSAAASRRRIGDGVVIAVDVRRSQQQASGEHDHERGRGRAEPHAGGPAASSGAARRRACRSRHRRRSGHGRGVDTRRCCVAQRAGSFLFGQPLPRVERLGQVTLANRDRRLGQIGQDRSNLAQPIDLDKQFRSRLHAGAIDGVEVAVEVRAREGGRVVSHRCLLDVRRGRAGSRGRPVSVGAVEDRPAGVRRRVAARARAIRDLTVPSGRSRTWAISW